MTLRKHDLVRRFNGWAPMVVLSDPDFERARVRVAYVPASVYPAQYAGQFGPEVLNLPTAQVVPLGEVRDNHKSRVTLEHLKACFGPAMGSKIYFHNNPTKETTMSKLYQTVGENPRFGTKLAVNSAGKIVLEMKGTGEVLAFDKREVEVVHPYTVDVKFPGGTTPYSYLSRKGEVEVGDLLLIEDEKVAKVVRIDTKSPRATKPLVGRKLSTTAIGEGLTAEVSDLLDD